MVISATDKTSYVQCLMHVIKGNLGAGILAMPATFAHCGLISAMIGLPILCFVAAYCAHLLIKTSEHLERRMMGKKMDYAELVKAAFTTGPKWLRPYSGVMFAITNLTIITCQMGSCVYLVFITENLYHIANTYTSWDVSKYYFFVAIFPFIILLSSIRTLKRLALASTFANCTQVVGIAIILHHLISEMPEKMHENHNKPLSEMALGFGSAVYSLEGLPILLPLYLRMKQPHLMNHPCGVINMGFTTLLVLYFAFGTLGYLKYGEQAKGSITLNLPNRPIFELVRGIYTVSIALTYPLQIYVAAEIIWNWAQLKFGLGAKSVSPGRMLAYEYLIRFLIVIVAFTMAMAVPNLLLIMDLFGSIAGTTLSLVLPPVVHLSVYWNETSGGAKFLLTLTDSVIITIGTVLGAIGAYFSLLNIYREFGDL